MLPFNNTAKLLTIHVVVDPSRKCDRFLAAAGLEVSRQFLYEERGGGGRCIESNGGAVPTKPHSRDDTISQAHVT